jgi:magnesium chelatase subunit H
LDGAIDPVPLGGLVGDQIYLIPDRVKRLTGRVKRWISLRHKPKQERKIAILLYGFPPGYGATGTAALLNVPRSLFTLLEALKQEGYHLGPLPDTGEALLARVKRADEAYEQKPDTPITTVNLAQLEQWLSPLLRRRVEKQWGSLTKTGLKTFKEEFLLGGVQLGNIWIGVQPPLGIAGDPMRLLFERDLTPHPQYAAFYQWIQKEFQADAILHFGMHGTVEWLPGSPLGNTGYSWSDILLGDLPHLYLYAANNSSESILAKRRGYGVLISHLVPPYSRAGLYKDLISLRELITEYREDPERNYALREAIVQKVTETGLGSDCQFTDEEHLGIELTVENIRYISSATFSHYMSDLYDYLGILENRLFSSGLHHLGQIPNAEDLYGYLQAYFTDTLPEDALQAISHRQEKVYLEFHPEVCPSDAGPFAEALRIRDLLDQTSEELTNLLRGLNGEYIPPSPGGDLLRDGPGVLPTGRNIHALDPYRMPSPGAYARGKAIARQTISQHYQEMGDYPETVAVMLWGLDAIKTKGESLGILLELVGAFPLKEATGRIIRYELIPMAEMEHPRIDVLVNLSGIFRDSFVNVIELLDDLFQRAAVADEPIEFNFIRKHVLLLQAQGIENAAARLFSNPSGDYGSLVNDRVVEANWESGEELGQTWQGRNQFSYGRQDKGQSRPEILNTLLKTTRRVIQEIDSVEYGLTDIQEYYANTGGLIRAAETQQGQKVKSSFVESFAKDPTPRSLEDLLRLEYRSKLLNPRWAEAMINQGSGGVYEISQRMTALLGWGGTTGFQDTWVYDQAAQTYALDPEMANRLQKLNPEAFRNVIGRLLEAHGRHFWQPDPEQLSQLQSLYETVDDTLEGIQYP